MRRLTINLLLLVIVLAAEHASALDCVKLAPSETHVEDAGYSRGLLWRIESVEGRVNHLFGTIHISDPRVTDLSPIVTEVLMSSDSFGMEVLLDVEAMLQMSKAMYYGAGQSLDQNLEPGLFERTVELLGEYGVSLEAARNLKPWAAYTTLSLPPGKTAMPLDLLLLWVARQGGKEVFGLESIGEQVAVFDGLAISDQTELLEQAVCHYGEFQSEIEKMIGHYVSRDLSAMMRMSMRYRSPLNDRFLDVVLWQRNRRMAERMLPHLQKGGAFIAVGALHLPGVDGVLDLLVKRGYDVQPID